MEALLVCPSLSSCRRRRRCSDKPACGDGHIARLQDQPWGVSGAGGPVRAVSMAAAVWSVAASQEARHEVLVDNVAVRAHSMLNGEARRLMEQTILSIVRSYWPNGGDGRGTSRGKNTRRVPRSADNQLSAQRQSRRATCW